MWLYLLGFLQFIVIAFICYYEFKLKSPIVFLWATLFVMFGIMHLIASFNGDISYPDIVLLKASLFVLFFCILYIFMRFILVKLIHENRYNILKFNTLQEKCINESFNLNFYLILLFTVIVFKIYPYAKNSGGLLATSWGAGREYASTLSYFNMNQVLTIIYYCLSGLAICSFLRNKKISTILILSLFTITVIISRNRIEILPVFISLLSVFIFKCKKINFRTIIFVLISMVTVIYVVYGLRVFRHYGSLYEFIQNFEFNDFLNKVNIYITTDNGELGLRRVFYYFIYNNNNFDNFGKAHSYIRMMLVFVPTKWSFGIKPPDFAQSMGAAIGMEQGGSTHPTLFGDCYANLGWFGILLGVFWAFYASIFDYILLKRKRKNYLVLLYSLFAVGNVIIGRGSVYNGFVYIAYGTIIILVLDHLSCVKLKN